MSPQPSNAIRDRTAVHEAGHAVVALLEGQQFDDIVIGTTDGVGAVVQNISYRDGDDEVIRIALAGIMAARLIRRSWRSPFLDTAFDDIGIVADFVRDAKTVDFLIEYNINRTEQLLLENWAAVTQIAKCFKQRQIVSYSDALAVVKNPTKKTETPIGRLGNDRWKPLEDQIRWRMQNPRGLADVLARLTERSAPKRGVINR